MLLWRDRQDCFFVCSGSVSPRGRGIHCQTARYNPSIHGGLMPSPVAAPLTRYRHELSEHRHCHLNKEDATFLPVIVSFSGITNYQAMVTSR
jgi:hypothetical protein